MKVCCGRICRSVHVKRCVCLAFSLDYSGGAEARLDVGTRFEFIKDPAHQLSFEDRTLRQHCNSMELSSNGADPGRSPKLWLLELTFWGRLTIKRAQIPE